MKVDKNDIKELLIAKDAEEMRAFLNNCLLWNAEDMNTIIECVKEFSKIDGVFDKHNNERINNNKENYTNEYLIDLNTDLTFNFSKERYLHALDVAYYLEMKNIDSERKRQASKGNVSDIKVEEIQKKKKNSIQVQKKKNSSLIGAVAIITVILVAMIVMNIIK